MTLFTPISSIPTAVAASAAGTFAAGIAERTAKTESANHALIASLEKHPTHSLDRDPTTASDRDADGWTGGDRQEGDFRGATTNASESSPTTNNFHRPRLPDELSGGLLDVVV